MLIFVSKRQLRYTWISFVLSHITMLTNLDHLEHIATYNRKRSQRHYLMREVATLLLIFFRVGAWSLIFVNAQLFYDALVDYQASILTWMGYKHQQDHISLGFKKQIESIGMVFEESQKLDQQYKKIDTFINQIKKEQTAEENVMFSAQSRLQSHLHELPFSFSVVSPTKRIIVAGQQINAPIVDLTNKDEVDLKKWNFDEELYQGVVKYPSTPTPWNQWNILIFGHTSYYWRKNNPFGTVFSKLPQIKNGEKIEMTRDGKLYTYEVIDKKIVFPKDVEKVYREYKDGEYVTLMGCYPLGTDHKRILVIAKRKELPTVSFTNQ